jgi:hypothetical protein
MSFVTYLVMGKGDQLENYHARIDDDMPRRGGWIYAMTYDMTG